MPQSTTRIILPLFTFEGLKQKGSMIIVPSTAVETMGLGALGGLTAFDRILAESQARAEGAKTTEENVMETAKDTDTASISDAKEKKTSEEV
jgi:hypothetical protein